MRRRGKKSVGGFLRGFAHAGRGFAGAVKKERNLQVHLAVLAAVVVAGIWLHLPLSGWALVTLAAGLVVSAELANTALEILADRVSQRKDPHIRSAKDTAAAAVLICAIVACVIGLLVFLPALTAKISRF